MQWRHASGHVDEDDDDEEEDSAASMSAAMATKAKKAVRKSWGYERDFNRFMYSLFGDRHTPRPGFPPRSSRPGEKSQRRSLAPKIPAS